MPLDGFLTVYPIPEDPQRKTGRQNAFRCVIRVLVVVTPVIMAVAVLLPSARDGFRAMCRLAGTVLVAGLAPLGRDVAETLLALGVGADVIDARHGSVFCHLPVTSFSIFSRVRPGNPHDCPYAAITDKRKSPPVPYGTDELCWLVAEEGLEPPASWLWATRAATALLRDMELKVGLEPTTCSLRVSCSAN